MQPPSRIRELAAVAALLLAASLLPGCRRDRPEDAAGHAADRDPALRALVDSMLPSLARLASLKPAGDIRTGRRDSAAVRAYVESRLDAELPPTVLASLHAVYSLLGLIPDTLDLRALLLRLYSEQIVGYYDPHERALYVVDGVAPRTVAPVLAHELVHALQDQHGDLDSLLSRTRGNDRQSAAHAALEGHATVVMFAYLAEQAQKRPLDPSLLPNPADQLAAGLREQNEQFPVFRAAPMILRETILFPYVSGADFVYELWQAKRRDRPAPFGFWLPQSTEQVLHPGARFLRMRDEPTEVEIAPQPPGAWRQEGPDDSLGELETGILLAQHLGEPARRMAEGWDGDRYRLLVNERGRQVLLWLSVWDDAAAADRFSTALQRIAPRLAPNAATVAHLRVQGRQVVRLLVAPSSIAVLDRDLPAWRLRP